MRKIILSVILITILVLTFISNFIIADNPIPAEAVKFDTGDTAWMIVATAFVLLMTPGLGFFYGGMVGKKNVISTMLQSFMAMVIVTILWVVVAFGLALVLQLEESSEIHHTTYSLKVLEPAQHGALHQQFRLCYSHYFRQNLQSLHLP